MLTAYIKLVGVDADYDEFEFPDDTTIKYLKTTILKTRESRLKGAIAADLQVFRVDDPDDDTAALSNRPEKIFTKLADIPTSVLMFLITSVRINLVAQPPAVPKWLEHTIVRARDRSIQPLPEASIPEPKPAPTPVGTSLSSEASLLQLLNKQFSERSESVDTPIVEMPIPRAAPGQTTRFATFVGQTVTEMKMTGDVFVPDAPTMIPAPGIDFAAERGGQDIKQTLHRMRMARSTIVDAKDDDAVWVADGTASSGKEFHPVPFEHIEEYCRTHSHCFESTTRPKLRRFFIDLDGYAPDTSPSEFRTIDKQICQALYKIFAKVGTVMTSSKHNAEIHTIGPVGTTRKKYANKLSYRVTFRKVYGSKQAMEISSIRDVLPVLQEALKDVCNVSDHVDAQRQNIAFEGRPYLMIDRWVYSFIGDRMRMLWSSKDLVVRPFLPVGDYPFMDTVMAFIPADAVRLPEPRETFRVSIWDAI